MNSKMLTGSKAKLKINGKEVSFWNSHYDSDSDKAEAASQDNREGRRMRRKLKYAEKAKDKMKREAAEFMRELEKA